MVTMLEESRPFASSNKGFLPGKSSRQQLIVHQIGELFGGFIIQLYEGLTVRPVYSTSCGSSSVSAHLVSLTATPKSSLGHASKHLYAEGRYLVHLNACF
jgi:hypothetical protein